MKRFLLLAPLSLFLIIALAFGLALNRDPSAIPSELIDRPLPDFNLPAIQGLDQGLVSAELTGDVVLLNVFGSWCVSCQVEHPFLMALAEGDEIPIYGLNWKDEPGAGFAWLERYGNPYTAVGDDQAGRTAIDLGVTGAPETFVIDKNGRVRFKFVGPITPEEWRAVLYPLIEELRSS
ncbi:MAG: DsbE family thiol:disulfide interchange protein [Pseudomonadota bacterium]